MYENNKGFLHFAQISLILALLVGLSVAFRAAAPAILLGLLGLLLGFVGLIGGILRVQAATILLSLLAIFICFVGTLIAGASGINYN